MRLRNLFEAVVVIALAVLFAVQGDLSARLKSLTKDEHTYVAAAAAIAELDDYSLCPEHPPYSMLASGLFMKPLKLEVEPVPDLNAPRAKFVYAHRFLRSNENRIYDLIHMARLPHILLGALLGLAVWYVVRRMFGKWAGLAALFLYSTDPNMLAHARLVHTDAGAAAFVFLAVACFIPALTEETSWRRPLCAALFFALAVLTKFSALALVVIFPALAAFWLLFELRRRWAASEGAERARIAGEARTKLLRVGASLLVLVPLLALILYRGQVQWYWRGLGMVLEHNRSGHWAYLLGEWSTHGWWYYFPIALAVKTPLPLSGLALAGLGFIFLGLKGARRNKAVMFAIAFALWLAGAMSSSLNIGIRHILPAYVFLFVFAGAAVAWLSANRPARVVLIGLMLWQGVSAYRTFPDYIAYFNEAAGGPAGGARYLVASNLDWGQELISLARYMEEKKIGGIVIYTIGAPLPGLYGIREIPMAAARPTEENPVYFAMGATFRASILREKEPDRDKIEAFLRDAEKVVTLGHSLTVYRVKKPFPKPLVRKSS
jgi:hypothetical protein